MTRIEADGADGESGDNHTCTQMAEVLADRLAAHPTSSRDRDDLIMDDPGADAMEEAVATLPNPEPSGTSRPNEVDTAGTGALPYKDRKC